MGLVYDSWLKSYRDGSRDMGAEMRRGDYFSLQRKRIQRLLASGSSVVVVAVEQAPSVICAWACLDLAPQVFHYVYTVAEHRRHGYARQLIGERSICTHLTDSRLADSFAAWKRRVGFRYMPHLLEAL